MFCPNCGRPVDETDNFCRNCGKNLAERLTEISLEKTTLNQNIPMAIEDLTFNLKGPVEVNRGSIITPDQIGRGIEFSFYLTDAAGDITSSDGEITFAVIRPRTYNYGPVGPFSQPLGTSALGQTRIQRNAKLFKTLAVTVLEFKPTIFLIGQGEKVPPIEQEKLAYTYLQLESLVYFHLRDYVFLHLWFTPAKGKILYKLTSLRWETD